jgi:acyl carrier protein
MEDLQFEEFAEFIRESCHLKRDKRIEPDTQFGRDLGVGGDDGSELLEAAEKRYGVTFTSEAFNLQPNEFLFSPEASLFDFISMFRYRKSKFRPFTVGELYEAIQKELNGKS